MISANAISLYSPATPVQAPVKPPAAPQPAAETAAIQTRDAAEAGGAASGGRGSLLDLKV